MSTSVSSEFFRYSKPIARTIRIRIPLHTNVPIVKYTEEEFSGSIIVDNPKLVRVFYGDVPLSNPTSLTGYQDYSINGNTIVMNDQTKTYKLRTYDWLSMNEFSIGNIIVADFGTSLRKFDLGLGVPCVPELTSVPFRGHAMVATDRTKIAYVPIFTGDDSFNYRLVNLYGQVSEPACIFVRTYRPDADGNDPNPEDLP